MKTLKFSPPLPELILQGKKDTTWRINDEKGIKENDELSLCSRGGKEFARAKVLWTKKTTFANLAKKDNEGHEKFASEKKMYETYSSYYGTLITPKTYVKVIKFSLNNKTS